MTELPARSAAAGKARIPVPELLMALGVAALGVLTLLCATTITVPLSANVVGPRVFPYAVGTALVGAGVAVVVALVHGRLGQPEGGEDLDLTARADWSTVGKILAGFVAHILLVDRLGWALAGALLFAVIAWALGASWWKATIIGVVLGLVIQAAFVSGLGVTLPAGLLDRVDLLNG